MKTDVRDGQLPRGAGTAGDVAIVPAASVLVLRDRPLEVLMIRRHKRSSFVPDAWVFPGGAVDAGDAALGDGSELATMRVAAARELFEEAGLWTGAPLEQSDAHRQALLQGTTTFASLVRKAPIDLERFVWTSRWITPAGVPKRFDTYFFLTEVGRDAVATAENAEAVEVIWISPADALRREAEGNFAMVFPTIKHLEAITSFDSVPALLDSRRGADIPTTRPILEDDHGRKRIVLPRPMEIASITAPNPGAFTLDGTRTYLLGRTALIDPGPAIESHIDAIYKAQPALNTIFITHRHADHAPAAVPLKAATGARIIAPDGVLDSVDVRVRGGETFEVEDETIEVIATPGHTAEHVCYMTASGDLFTGDTILGTGTTAIFPPDGNMSDYLESLKLLRRRNPKRILPAHGPTRDDATALIDEYIAHRIERERQVIEAIRRGARTIPEMRRRIYRDLDPRLERAAEVQMLAHLIKLQEEGRVGVEGEQYRLL